MTFDPRPLERMTSLMVTGVVLFMSLMFGGTAALMGLLTVFDYPIVGLGMLCLTLPPIPVGAVLLLWLMRWTRRGSVDAYVGALESALGVSGTLEGPTLLFSLLTPEWTAELEGRRVRVRMRRTAGFLSPLSPAGGLGLPWTLQVFIDGDGSPSKVGFTHPKAATLGVGLLGLSNPVKTDAVQVFVGSRPEVGEDETVLARAGEMAFGPTTLLAVDGSGLTWSDRMSDLPADAMAERLRQLTSLLGAVEAVGA